MFNTREETYDEVIGEIKPLLDLHWQEIALNKDTVKLDPDYSVYQTMEQANMMSITTVRKDEELVGYAIYFYAKNPHYKTQVVAESDIFYLKPEHRNAGVGSQLILAAEANLRARGVNKIMNRVKIHFDTGPLFEKIGYKAIERVYAKLI